MRRHKRRCRGFLKKCPRVKTDVCLRADDEGGQKVLCPFSVARAFILVLFAVCACEYAFHCELYF